MPVSIEATEFNVMLEFVRRGQFHINYGQWVGGNQDPIFYRDLFATSEIPTETRAARNRSRYSNQELDQILTEAANTYDHEKAMPLYARAQEIVSRDVPVFPLWYQANMVIAKKSVGNINVNASGDWGFVKDLRSSTRSNAGRNSTSVAASSAHRLRRPRTQHPRRLASRLPSPGADI